MTRFGRAMLAAGLLAMAVGGVPPAAAQEHQRTTDVARDAVAPASQAEASENQIDIVHHIGNAHELELPFGVIHLPRWEPIHIGGFAIDLSPTKHLVFMLVSAILVAWSSSLPRAPWPAPRRREGRPRGSPARWRRWRCTSGRK